MVSAWSAQNRVVLAQVKTEEKSNEITAIPRLLDLLQIKNCMVTIDAMGCQKEIAKKIVDGGADYLLAVKDNQPTLSADIVALFEEARQDPQLRGIDGLPFDRGERSWSQKNSLLLDHVSRRSRLATDPVAEPPDSGPDRVGAHCRWEDHAGTAPLHLLQVVSVREERHGGRTESLGNRKRT